MAEGLGQVAKLNQRKHLRLVPSEGPGIRDIADEDLMLRHADGMEDAFNELVRRHQRGILNYMFRMVQNRQVAEELTQEVFIALVRNAQRYEPRAKFTTYLYTIASNIVSKEWLRQKRRPKLFSFQAPWGKKKNSDDEFNPVEHVGDARACVLTQYEHTEVTTAVTAALQHLPEHQREAFVLRRFQDVPYEDIAAITGAPVGTVKSRVVRAERALRPLLSSFREYI
jgi:RNA polymerase sigma-70 factor (ECF subfamily)